MAAEDRLQCLFRVLVVRGGYQNFVQLVFLVRANLVLVGIRYKNLG